MGACNSSNNDKQRVTKANSPPSQTQINSEHQNSNN